MGDLSTACTMRWVCTASTVRETRKAATASAARMASTCRGRDRAARPAAATPQVSASLTKPFMCGKWTLLCSWHVFRDGTFTFHFSGFQAHDRLNVVFRCVNSLLWKNEAAVPLMATRGWLMGTSDSKTDKPMSSFTCVVLTGFVFPQVLSVSHVTARGAAAVKKASQETNVTAAPTDQSDLTAAPKGERQMLPHMLQFSTPSPSVHFHACHCLNLVSFIWWIVL